MRESRLLLCGWIHLQCWQFPCLAELEPNCTFISWHNSIIHTSSTEVSEFILNLSLGEQYLAFARIGFHLPPCKINVLETLKKNLNWSICSLEVPVLLKSSYSFSMTVFYKEKRPFLWILGILSDQNSLLLSSWNLRIMPSLKLSFNSSRLVWCFHFIEKLLPSENIKSSSGFLAKFFSIKPVVFKSAECNCMC